jgi:hypothetical protein
MKTFIIYITLCLFSLNIIAQENVLDTQIKLNNYLEIPQEIVYLHLNKSTYIKGEQIAFTAYVLKDQDFTKSTATTNLYLQISNEKDEIIKEKLLLVEDGIAFNSIQIDSTFVSGKYTINAFTNWMRNFSTPTYFSESIRIIDIDQDDSDGYTSNNTIQAKQTIDIQFLPESGHLLSGVLNTMGVIAKTPGGSGLVNANIEIFDNNNTSLATLQLNQFGIGKFSFVPEIDKTYKAKVIVEDKAANWFDINVPVERNGIILSATITKKELRLLVKTKPKNKLFLKNETFTLLIHNSTESKAYDISFRDDYSIPFLFNLENFKPGMNMITIFNSKNEIIAERLFFNTNNLPLGTLGKAKVTASVDSLEIKIRPEKRIDSLNLSVSVLPQNSISGGHHHSILSNTLLKPYVKGPIQRADWYLNSIDNHKIQELDKLLITQGWSAYDWKFIFKEDKEIRHNFESKLEFKATLNKPKNKEQEFLIHATDKRPPQIIKLPAGENSFLVNNFIHFEDEELAISKREEDKLLPANLFIQFQPNVFPKFEMNPPYSSGFETLEKPINYDKTVDLIAFNSGREVLDEVIVEKKVDKVKERERELEKKTIWSTVSVVKYEDIVLFRTLSRYLNSKPAISAAESQGELIVTTGFSNYALGKPRGPEGGSSQPETQKNMQLYLDDIPVSGSVFYQYPMENVDYIKINRRGFGGGFMDANGSIRIYSNFDSVFGSSKVAKPQIFDYPVAFQPQKKYYVPKYSSENSDFFKDYGVIDWKPDLTLSENGTISFKIKKPVVDYQLIIQGVSTNGTLVNDTKKVSLEIDSIN